MAYSVEFTDQQEARLTSLAQSWGVSPEEAFSLVLDQAMSKHLLTDNSMKP